MLLDLLQTKTICIPLQTSMNVPIPLHVKTMVPVQTQTAHTLVTVQMHGQGQIVQLVKAQFCV
jgi:hypothetical protein